MHRRLLSVTSLFKDRKNQAELLSWSSRTKNAFEWHILSQEKANFSLPYFSPWVLIASFLREWNFLNANVNAKLWSHINSQRPNHKDWNRCSNPYCFNLKYLVSTLPPPSLSLKNSHSGFDFWDAVFAGVKPWLQFSPNRFFHLCKREKFMPMSVLYTESLFC